MVVYFVGVDFINLNHCHWVIFYFDDISAEYKVFIPRISIITPFCSISKIIVNGFWNIVGHGREWGVGNFILGLNTENGYSTQRTHMLLQ